MLRTRQIRRLARTAAPMVTACFTLSSLLATTQALGIPAPSVIPVATVAPIALAPLSAPAPAPSLWIAHAAHVGHRLVGGTLRKKNANYSSTGSIASWQGDFAPFLPATWTDLVGKYVRNINSLTGNMLTSISLVGWHTHGAVPIDFTLYHNSEGGGASTEFPFVSI